MSHAVGGRFINDQWYKIMDYSATAFALSPCWAASLAPEVICARYQGGVIDVLPAESDSPPMDPHICTLFKPIFRPSKDSTTTDVLVWVCTTCGREQGG